MQVADISSRLSTLERPAYPDFDADPLHRRVGMAVAVLASAAAMRASRGNAKVVLLCDIDESLVGRDPDGGVTFAASPNSFGEWRDIAARCGTALEIGELTTRPVSVDPTDLTEMAMAPLREQMDPQWMLTTSPSAPESTRSHLPGLSKIIKERRAVYNSLDPAADSPLLAGYAKHAIADQSKLSEALQYDMHGKVVTLGYMAFAAASGELAHLQVDHNTTFALLDDQHTRYLPSWNSFAGTVHGIDARVDRTRLLAPSLPVVL